MSLHLFPICVHNLVLFWLPVKAGQKKSKHIILVRLTVTIHNALSLQFHIRNISRTVSLYSQNIFWLEYFKCILSGKLTNVQHFQNSCLYFRGCHFPCTQQQSCPSYTQQWFNNTTMWRFSYPCTSVINDNILVNALCSHQWASCPPVPPKSTNPLCVLLYNTQAQTSTMKPSAHWIHNYYH